MKKQQGIVLYCIVESRAAVNNIQLVKLPWMQNWFPFTSPNATKYFMLISALEMYVGPVFVSDFNKILGFYMGARCWWRSWLRHCATSRKVAGSIPDYVIGIFSLT